MHLLMYQIVLKWRVWFVSIGCIKIGCIKLRYLPAELNLPRMWSCWSQIWKGAQLRNIRAFFGETVRRKAGGTTTTPGCRIVVLACVVEAMVIARTCPNTTPTDAKVDPHGAADCRVSGGGQSE